MSVLQVSKSNFNEIVRGSDKPVLVKFGATWCGPCKALAPTLAKLAINPDILVVEVDIDEDEELTQEFGIRGVPTVVSVVDGKIHARHTGVTSADTLLALLK